MSTLLQRREKLIGQAPLFYEEPVHIVRGEGVCLYDPNGKQYIDMYNNVPCVGHANPRIVAAMSEQMATLNVHSRYLHEGVLNFAEQLLELHHPGMEQVVFACSGTEASEIALLMARHATGARGIVCTDATYHGNSTEVIKMSGRPVTAPEFRSIPFPQSYQPIEVDGSILAGEALTDYYLGRLEAAIEDLNSSGVPFAGLFVCSIFANEGLPDVPPGFMSKAVDLVHRAGGVVIADEVQAGYCRSGNWWGYETTGFTPDIATMGKPMGNGLPLSAVVASEPLVTAFRKNTRYFNTFASSPLQAAVGLAVLKELKERDLVNQAAGLGSYLREQLREMMAGCESMGDIRGSGLFVGIEWVQDRQGKTPDREGAVRVANLMKDRGFLLSNAGAKGNVVKVRPPLVFEQQHADAFLEAFSDMLTSLRDAA